MTFTPTDKLGILIGIVLLVVGFAAWYVRILRDHDETPAEFADLPEPELIDQFCRGCGQLLDECRCGDDCYDQAPMSEPIPVLSYHLYPDLAPDEDRCQVCGAAHDLEQIDTRADVFPTYLVEQVAHMQSLGLRSSVLDLAA